MNELINALTWVAICRLVFFAWAGFAGRGRPVAGQNSIQRVIAKIYCGTCLVGVGFWVAGYGLASGGNRGGPSATSLFAPEGLKGLRRRSACSTR